MRFAFNIAFVLLLSHTLYCQQNNWSQYKVHGGFYYLYSNPTEPGVLYTISMGSVHRSTDGGVHWQSFRFNYMQAYFEKLFFDLADKNHWIILTLSAVIESFDGGQSFSWYNDDIDRNDLNFPDFYLRSLAQNPFDKNILLVCGPGIYRSTDRGVHWEKIRSGRFYNYIMYDVSIKNQVYSTYFEGGPGVKKYFLKSTNNGVDWQLTVVNVDGYYPLYQIPNGTIYLGNLFSTDRGTTWTKIKPASPRTRDEAKGEYIAQYAYDSKNQYLYAVDQSKGLLKLNAGGDTWELTHFSLYDDLFMSLTRKPATSVALDTLNDRLYVISGDSLFVSEKGKDFVPVPTQLYFPIVRHIAFKGKDTLLAAVERVGRSAISTDRGTSWEDINWYNEVESASFLPFDNFLFIQHRLGQMYYSQDYGKTFTDWLYPGSDYNDRMEVNPLDPSKIFGCGFSGFFFVTKQGVLDTTMTPELHGLTPFAVPDFEFHPTEPSTYYVTSYEGTYSSNVYKTTNGGTDWIALTNNTGLDSVYRAIAVDPNNPNRIYVATDWGIIYTHDEGVTWNKGKGPMPNSSFGQSEWFTGIVVDPRASNIIYTSARSALRQIPPESNSSGGVYCSRDYGATWQPMNMEGLLNVSVNWLQYKDKPPRLIACTMGGAYEYILPDPVSVKEEKEVPTNFLLLSIYPNPVSSNQRVVINYQLPKRAFVEIIVYDLLGRRVALLVNDYIEAGKHQANLLLNSLETGMYFVKLNAGGTYQTKKLIVMK